MQVWHQPVCQVQTDGTGKNSDYGNQQISIFQRRQNQPQNGGGQHHPRREGQHNVAEFMGDIPKRKANHRADNGSAAHAQSGQQNKLHKNSFPVQPNRRA